MKSRHLALGFACIALGAFSGCGSGEDPGPDGKAETAPSGRTVTRLVPGDIPSGLRPATSADVEGREFRLVAADTDAIPPGIDPRLGFDAGRIEASVACNPIDGEYEIDDGTLRTKRFSAYPGGCEPERMEAERWLVDLLKRPEEIRTDGQRLLLGADPGAAMFEPISPTEERLQEFVWFNGRTKLIFTDGEYTVLAPCGNGTANVVVGEETIEFAEFTVFDPCRGDDLAEEAAAQEPLPGEVSFTLDGRSLTLSGGGTQSVFEGVRPTDIG